MRDGDSKATRRLPSVDTVLRTSTAQAVLAEFGHAETVVAIRSILAAQRRELLKTASAVVTEHSAPEAVAAAARRYLLERNQPALRRVINASGIILHTGLGRACMPECARQALAGITGYCNLQQDLETGRREQREDCLRQLVRDLTGAEDVLVVNNNAAATLLMLAALTRGREVVVSRGELIEIGGFTQASSCRAPQRGGTEAMTGEPEAVCPTRTDAASNSDEGRRCGQRGVS